MYGTYETIDGKPAVRFERVYPHPVEHVWRSVTEPERARALVPDHRRGRPARGRGDDVHVPRRARWSRWTARVLELDPPRTFAFLWGDEVLRFELAAEGDGCRLTLTHLISNADEAARNAAGWHVCLDKLGGEESDWEPLYEEYERRGVPAGAEIPGRLNRVPCGPVQAPEQRIFACSPRAARRGRAGPDRLVELALYASPFLLLAGLLLSGRFVGEETILRRRVAAVAARIAP